MNATGSTNIDISVLKNLISRHWESLSLVGQAAALRTIERLEEGTAPALEFIPGASEEKNSGSIIRNGREFTDTLGTWIKRGFVAGPFDSPPFEGFKVNRVLGVVQKDKTRPVLDLSAPAGNSFNDAVIKDKLRKVKTFTAKDMGQELLRRGSNAVFTKIDWSDAYKNIPVHKDYAKFQGFKWLGKYFLESRLVFGASNAVADFDDLALVVAELAEAEAGTDRLKILRTIDDVPVVGERDGIQLRKFFVVYKSMCRDLNIRLADECPQRKKAFGPGRTGVVLGMFFDSRSLSWKLPEDKVADYGNFLNFLLDKGTVNAEELQRILGAVEHVSQMCPFLKLFRHNAYRLLSVCLKDESAFFRLEKSVRYDMGIWANVLRSCAAGLPLVMDRGEPGPSALFFISDAAGAARGFQGGPLGVAGARTSKDMTEAVPLGRIWWPLSFIKEASDSRGHSFGSKSTTLECIGLLLPALTCPSRLEGRDVVLLIDNEAAVYGWRRKFIKNDLEASVFIRTLGLIEARLGCRFFVRHAPRRASVAAKLVDDLSRASTSSLSAAKTINSPALSAWFSNPSIDWTLPEKLLEEVQAAL